MEGIKQHVFTREIFCPHCDHEHVDSWEFGETPVSEEIEPILCHNCGEMFYAQRCVDITYKSCTDPIY